MLKLSDEAAKDLAGAVQKAVGRADVRAAVEEIYRRLQLETDQRKPKCNASGRCCRFEEYGHRLFVTTIELATFLLALREGEAPAEPSSGRPGARLGGSLALPLVTSGCPYQVDGFCSVHSIRPFGCRIFFCDPTAQDWQNERYELFHAELMRLHDRFGIPYFYVEWREALRALGLGTQTVLSRT